ncbi:MULTISPECIES: hypothetical protein [unclassified Synechocystis]|uniref:hypothetical protein n=1 Tax=unclassified Synechocystis TaxID=2640012 RepID=UPI00040209AD|nr:MULTISPECIES: hypothetical protein [unclassified Synechocystis]AIE75801.1 hypothetical protein D082_32730 [Synechocystis sp. PCC 6714]MCT0255264.1 hypothetical protein [Synechocystis sp. CS-94]
METQLGQQLPHQANLILPNFGHPGALLALKTEKILVITVRKIHAPLNNWRSP